MGVNPNVEVIRDAFTISGVPALGRVPLGRNGHRPAVTRCSLFRNRLEPSRGDPEQLFRVDEAQVHAGPSYGDRRRRS